MACKVFDTWINFFLIALTQRLQQGLCSQLAVKHCARQSVGLPTTLSGLLLRGRGWSGRLVCHVGFFSLFISAGAGSLPWQPTSETCQHQTGPAGPPCPSDVKEGGGGGARGTEREITNKKVEVKRKIAKKGGVGSGILNMPTDSNGYMWKREKSW